jgi:hypothetical protein
MFRGWLVGGALVFWGAGVGWGQILHASGPLPSFEVVSIKPMKTMVLEQDPAAPGPEGELDASGTPIFTALQEQLGLKLEPAKAPVKSLVIDHVERPSAN